MPLGLSGGITTVKKDDVLVPSEELGVLAEVRGSVRGDSGECKIGTWAWPWNCSVERAGRAEAERR